MKQRRTKWARLVCNDAPIAYADGDPLGVIVILGTYEILNGTIIGRTTS